MKDLKVGRKMLVYCTSYFVLFNLEQNFFRYVSISFECRNSMTRDWFCEVMENIRDDAEALYGKSLDIVAIDKADYDSQAEGDEEYVTEWHDESGKLTVKTRKYLEEGENNGKNPF